jgi:hypothetical protein
MSPEEIADAYEDGRFDLALGAEPEHVCRSSRPMSKRSASSARPTRETSMHRHTLAPHADPTRAVDRGVELTSHEQMPVIYFSPSLSVEMLRND